MTRVSVRLGELTEAVDREAALARRTRSEMVRFLIEEALATRREGALRHLGGGRAYLERFEGCPVPPLGATYRVTDDQWYIGRPDKVDERVIRAYELSDER